MRELSGKHVFQGPFDLAIQDVLSAYIDDESPSSRPADRKRFHARNDDGQWLPFLDGQFAEIQREVRRILQSPLKHALKNDPDTARLAQNPSAARRLRAACASPLASTQFRKFIASEWPEVFAQIRTEFGAREEDSDAWRDFFVGRLSPEKMSAIWSDSLSDLPCLAPVVGQNSGRILSNVSACRQSRRRTIWLAIRRSRLTISITMAHRSDS